MRRTNFLIERRKFRRKFVPWLLSTACLCALLYVHSEHILAPIFGLSPRTIDNAPNVRAKREIIDSATLFENKEQCARMAVSNDSSDQFPPDLFSLQTRKQGAIVLHFAGLVYMFVALAVVCDEFFVPSLTVLTEVLDISDDVAGATFMAAGGSAPEFFTSVFGVFVAQNNVGIGTIVGSATFNILCVLAFCTLFSKDVLHLTWWPLFRDVTFYIVALFLLVIFFADEKINVYEASTMFVIYILYGIFMKYNENLEHFVKTTLFGNPHIAGDGHHMLGMDTLKIGDGRMEPRRSVPMIHGSHNVRAGIAQIALGEDDGEGGIATPDHTVRVIEVQPAGENVYHRSNSDRPSIRTVSGIVDSGTTHNGHNGNDKQNGHAVSNGNHNGHAKTNGMPAAVESNGTANGLSAAYTNEDQEVARATQQSDKECAISISSNEEPPLDLSWPPDTSKRLVYLCIAPITFPLAATLPDVRKTHLRNWFIWTFVGAILWIAFFSYLMVWWANVIGETMGIPTEIMGLTILAAGTSIPDLITSVIVARKGLGDMAVSSSIGSNLFDICVGLPVPWLLYFGASFFRLPDKTLPTVDVVSNGLICSVGMLFFMLVVLVICIAVSRWRMDKRFGLLMIVSYLVFCVFSILLETGHLTCPLRISGLAC